MTLNVEKGEVHPRRKDKMQNDTWVAFGVRSVVAWRHEDVFPRQVWRAMLLSSLSTSRPRRIGWRLRLREDSPRMAFLIVTKRCLWPFPEFFFELFQLERSSNGS